MRAAMMAVATVAVVVLIGAAAGQDGAPQTWKQKADAAKAAAGAADGLARVAWTAAAKAGSAVKEIEKETNRRWAVGEFRYPKVMTPADYAATAAFMADAATAGANGVLWFEKATNKGTDGAVLFDEGNKAYTAEDYEGAAGKYSAAGDAYTLSGAWAEWGYESWVSQTGNLFCASALMDLYP